MPDLDLSMYEDLTKTIDELRERHVSVEDAKLMFASLLSNEAERHMVSALTRKGAAQYFYSIADRLAVPKES